MAQNKGVRIANHRSALNGTPHIFSSAPVVTDVLSISGFT